MAITTALQIGLAGALAAGSIGVGAVVLRSSGPFSDRGSDNQSAALPISGRSWVVEVYAGDGTMKTGAPAAVPGYQDGNRGQAVFDRPVGLVFDRDKNLLVADSGNRRIRKVSANGNVSTVAGNGDNAVVDGPAAKASFRTPVGVAVGPDGTIYVADAEANQIRAISVDGQVTTVAGIDYRACTALPPKDSSAPEAKPPDCPADFEPSFRDGPAAIALFSEPAAIAVSPDGTLFVSDSGNHRIRKISPEGIVSTFSGTGEPGFRDGKPFEAMFTGPVDLEFESGGALLVTEQGNLVRRFDGTGNVSTVVGLPGVTQGGFADGAKAVAAFHSPAGLTVGPAGETYLSDAGNQRIRAVQKDGSTSTIAGRGGQGLVTGAGSAAQFSYPADLEIGPDGALYVADYNMGRILRISTR